MKPNSPITSHFRPALKGLALVALAATLGACGSSQRADFYQSRSIVSAPSAGTGEPLGEELAQLIAEDIAAFADASPNTTPISSR